MWSTGVIASNLMASNITYTPKDSTWTVNNVEAAIDSLKLSKTESNYSTEEKAVGTWIDGKPLYQKTFVLSNVTSGSYSIAHNIDDIDKVAYLGGVNGSGRPIPYAYGSNGTSWYAGCDMATGNLRVEAGSAYINESSTLYITIQYTKTTDQANS